MDFASYDYKGYTLVVTPANKVLVHEGTGTHPPTGNLVGEAQTSLGHAMKVVDGLVTEVLVA